MKNKIQIAFVISKKYDLSPVINTLISKGITLDIFENINNIVNTTFYDVIFVHDAFLHSFKRELFPNSAVIIITNELNRVPEIFPKVKDMAVYTVLALPLVSIDLIKHIENAKKAFIEEKTLHASQTEKGRSIIISSFSNGSGKSLVSYNIASKLAHFFPDNAVCLVDMNKPLSVGKAMLNIEESYSWQTLKPLLQEGIVDKQKIANIVYLTKYRFSLLSGPTSLQKNQPLTYKEFENLDASLKKIFKIVIYDFHTIESINDIAFVNHCDLPLIINDLNAAAILQTMRGIEQLKVMNNELTDTAHYVVNRADENSGRSADLIASRLDITPFGVIDNDPEAVQVYSQNGQLFEDRSLLLDKQLYLLSESIVKKLF